MKIKKYNDVYFFFEDKASDLCEDNLLRFHYPHRFPIVLESAIDEFVENYYDYLCGSRTNYDKLFTEGQIVKEITGLKYAIWIDQAGKDRNVSHHEPRLKVCFEGEEYPLYFKDEVKFVNKVPDALKRELPAIKEFIYYNKRDLLAYWYRCFDDVELLKKKIAKKQAKTGAINKKTLTRFNLND